MFEEFEKFRGKKAGPNKFWPVTSQQIKAAEKQLGHRLPQTLRQFYAKVGCGFWGKGAENLEWERSLINGILSPEQIADLVHNPENLWRPKTGFVEGTIPFFDTGESDFLVVWLRGEPLGVFWPSGELMITPTIADFFSQLSQNARFYLDQLL